MYLSLGLQVQAARLTAFLPDSIYDVRRIDGFRFVVRLSKPEDYMIVYMAHERAFTDVKPRIGDVALDVGAHIGSYTLRYSRLVGERGRVVSFEPDLRNRRILRWNLELNEARNVQVRSEALGDFTGIAKLKISSFPGMHSFVRESSNIRRTPEVAASVVRLDDLGLERVDFLKLDVEGYEMNVLMGGKETVLSQRPRMQIEVHTPHRPECPVCGWLQDEGFVTRVLESSPGSHWIEAH